MVGPISEAERATFRRKVKIGVALLVGVSAGLVAVQIDATLVQAGGATLGGLALGAVLAWYIVPSESPLTARRSGPPDRDNPFADGGRNGDSDEGRSGSSDGAGNRDDRSDRTRR